MPDLISDYNIFTGYAARRKVGFWLDELQEAQDCCHIMYLYLWYI